jgi:hypothetical protein
LPIPLQKKVKKDPSTISSIEEAKAFIEGKTFMATPAGADNLWFKASFSNGSFTLYTATPQIGTWGEAHRGTYEMGQGRYRDTGQKFFYVRMETGSIFTCSVFYITDMSFVLCDALDKNDRAQATIGDINPWN